MNDDFDADDLDLTSEDLDRMAASGVPTEVTGPPARTWAPATNITTLR